MQTSHYLSDGDTVTPETAIDLNDGQSYFLISGSLDLSTRGTVKFDLYIEGDSARAAAEKGAALKSLLSLAQKRSADYHSINWVTYILQRGTEAPAYLDIVSGDMTLKELFPLSDAEVWSVEMQALPYFRWEPIELPITEELENGDAILEALDVPGSIDALVRFDIHDTSDLTGDPLNAINRIRGARISGEGARATDWQPFVNFESVMDEVSLEYSHAVVEDAGSVGGDFVRASFLTDGGTYVGTMFTTQEMPAGELNRGERDVWVRARADAEPIFFDGEVDVTVVPPDIESVAVVGWEPPDIKFLDAERSTAANTPAVPSMGWSGSTAAGSTLVAFLSGFGGTGTTPPATTPVGTGRLAAPTWQEYIRENTPAHDQYTTWVLIAQNAPAVSGATGTGGAFSWTANATGSTAILQAALFEIANGDTDALELLVDAYDAASAHQHTLAGVASTIDNVGLLAVRVQRPTATHVPSLTWFNGFAEIADAAGFNAAEAVQPVGASLGMSVRGAIAVPDADLFLMGFRGGQTVLNQETSRVDSGNLETGTLRQFTIYAVDNSGFVGASITSDPTGIVYSGSRIELDWPDAAGADTYIAEWTAFGDTYRMYTTKSQLTVRDEADAVYANDLPPIVVGEYAGNELALIHGTGADPYPAVGQSPSVMIVPDNTFRWLPLATAHLPSAGTLLDGTTAPATVYIQTDAGGSRDPITDVDALWCVPHTEPQFIAEYPTLTMPQFWPEDAERHWVLESTRRGNAMVGWVEDENGIVRGSVRVTGRMLYAPGDDLVSLLCDGYHGVATMGALTFTVRVTLWPRSHWQNWTEG